MDPRTPFLVGASQLTVRDQPGPEPLDLWERVAREAACDAWLPAGRLDSIQLVYTDSWRSAPHGPSPLTKHTYAVWSTEPGGALGDATPVFTAKPVPIVAAYEGPAAVAGYTVAHGRDGAAEKGILVVDLPEGGRAHAHVLRDDLMADAESRELVGREVWLATDGRVNVASW
ncbi:hypothetical protein ABZ297_13340 [Nonomuraea sp. NPDC005983]|uniref:hypothetical protein n=1 Tax=Nonomuraea sp. NPDC005983 TaxID=3155595 RepID=UPI0033BCA0F7